MGKGVWIKIIDKYGDRCGPNESGELCLKVNYKFAGYFGNENATRETIDSKGFFLTRDIGYFDEDGNMFISGRKNDMLKYHESYLCPGDIEDFLVLHPGIDSVCIVGIPNGYDLDLPAAVVIRKKDVNMKYSK